MEKKKSKLNLIIAIALGSVVGLSLGVLKTNIQDHKNVKHNILETKEKRGDFYARKYCNDNLKRYDSLSVFEKYAGVNLGMKKASEEYLE